MLPPQNTEPVEETLELLRESLSLLEHERVQAGYDLHDGPLQHLVAASMFLEALLSDLRKQHSPFTAQGERAADSLRHGIAGLRKFLSGETAELAGEHLPLDQAVKAMIEHQQSELGLKIDVTTATNFPPMAHVRKRSILLILQESLRNVWRHSGQLHASVKLTAPTAGHYRLELQDHGKGFDLATAPLDHFGMRGMRQRAGWIGADLTVASTVEGGTTVVLEGACHE